MNHPLPVSADAPSQVLISPDRPWLAPLAGWSDLPFRLLCRKLGAGVCCTEMISAKGLVYGGRNTEALLATTEEDLPLVAQLFGAEPPFMGQAVQVLRDRGFAWFDVNMGCSVHKVNKTGSGSALLKDADAAKRVAEAVLRAAPPGRAGFKLRLGWEDRGHMAEDVVFSLAGELQAMGAAWITLHPRYAKQGFTGEARHSATARLAQELRIPVIASGDLFSAEDGIRVLRQTGAATVMYARGALNDPAIFARHLALLGIPGPCSLPSAPHGEPLFARAANTREELAAIIRCHARLAARWAPHSALLKMRTIVPRYVRHLDGAKALRQRLITCTAWEDLDRIIKEELGGSVQFDLP